MKIAMVHGPGFYYNGGGERIVIEETKGLRSRGHTVDLYSPHVETNYCFPEETVKLGIIPFFKNLNLPCQAAVSMMLSSAIYPILAHRLKSYDALICHSQPAIWLGYKTRKPFIAYVHRPNCFLYPKPVDRWNYDVNMLMLDKIVRAFPLSRKLDLESTKEADKILTTSRWIAEWTKEVYECNPTKCPPAPSRPFHENHMRWHWSRNWDKYFSPKLLTVTRHVPIKRLDWNLQIFQRLRKQFEYAVLTIVGKHSSHTNALRKLAENLGIKDRVWMGQNISDSELLNIYRNNDFYISCAPMEDFGIAPLEAMSMGLPLIVWDFGGTAELVEHGETGFKARSYDLDDFYRKTVNALSLSEEEDRKLSENARAKAEEYTWKAHLDILEKEIQKIA